MSLRRFSGHQLKTLLLVSTQQVVVDEGMKDKSYWSKAADLFPRTQPLMTRITDEHTGKEWWRNSYRNEREMTAASPTSQKG